MITTLPYNKRKFRVAQGAHHCTAVSRQDANLQAPLGPGCRFESPYELDAHKSHWLAVALCFYRCSGAHGRMYAAHPRRRNLFQE